MFESLNHTRASRQIMLAANLTPELFGIMKPAKLEITFPIRRARDYGGEKKRNLRR